MDYTRKNSGDNIQDSELVKINQNTTLNSLNNKKKLRWTEDSHWQT